MIFRGDFDGAAAHGCYRGAIINKGLDRIRERVAGETAAAAQRTGPQTAGGHRQGEADVQRAALGRFQSVQLDIAAVGRHRGAVDICLDVILDVVVGDREAHGEGGAALVAPGQGDPRAAAIGRDGGSVRGVKGHMTGRRILVCG